MVTQKMRKALDLPWIVRLHRGCRSTMILQLNALGYDTVKTNRFDPLDMKHQNGSKRSMDFTLKEK